MEGLKKSNHFGEWVPIESHPALKDVKSMLLEETSLALSRSLRILKSMFQTPLRKDPLDLLSNHLWTHSRGTGNPLLARSC